MHVLRNQAVGVKIKREVSIPEMWNAGEPEIVLVRTEYLGAVVVAASSYVIQASGDFDSWLPGHDGWSLRLVASQMSAK
jgi:hypothetical protein